MSKKTKVTFGVSFPDERILELGKQKAQELGMSFSAYVNQVLRKDLSIRSVFDENPQQKDDVNTLYQVAAESDLAFRKKRTFRLPESFDLRGKEIDEVLPHLKEYHPALYARLLEIAPIHGEDDLLDVLESEGWEFQDYEAGVLKRAYRKLIKASAEAESVTKPKPVKRPARPIPSQKGTADGRRQA
ncbi:MAG: hypothetical protein Q7Q73_03370 [Verrucomicrobiota bacterium JB024]|nr:hypothetical protein [Verrucomicrobiota bacterium JB024]